MTESGLTVLAHITALMDEKDKRDQQRYDAQSKALDAARIAADLAVQAALQAAKEAVLKAELAADKRFELLNELRVGVSTKEEVEALEKRLNEMAARLDRIEGRSGGLSAGWGYLVGAVGMVVAVIAIYTNLRS